MQNVEKFMIFVFSLLGVYLCWALIQDITADPVVQRQPAWAVKINGIFESPVDFTKYGAD